MVNRTQRTAPNFRPRAFSSSVRRSSLLGTGAVRTSLRFSISDSLLSDNLACGAERGARSLRPRDFASHTCDVPAHGAARVKGACTKGARGKGRNGPCCGRCPHILR